MVVIKLNANGSELLYSTYLGGTGSEYAYDIAVDGNGSAYVTGNTQSDDFPVTSGAFQTNRNSIISLFVTKLNPSGSELVYSTFVGGADYGVDIAVDGSGNAYVAADTYDDNFPVTSRAFQTTFAGHSDAVIAKLNSTGSDLVYGTYLGGSTSERVDGLAVDESGNAYVVGRTESPNFPVTSGAFDTNFDGWYEGFVVKLNPTGSDLVFSTFLGGQPNGPYLYDSEMCRGVAVDGSGNIYVTGLTASNTFPVIEGAYDESHNGDDDAFMSKLNPTGSELLYSTYLGGTSFDYGEDIVLDARGNVYVAGFTRGQGFPNTIGTYTGRGGFVVKLGRGGGEPEPTETFTPDPTATAQQTPDLTATAQLTPEPTATAQFTPTATPTPAPFPVISGVESCFNCRAGLGSSLG